ncbi:ribosomal L28 family-domain-containing protein [Durotheca rogersii]|uniref:ribosomal L28 family-domain-containing protein n=1 Tax=Durotheca rogersii TaxID=419775 RepID=UPI0022208AB2|nr:ribosomal L28 family-domain-containing protein [Durotheca rogersii]KAI5856664.1 ribosomal L28 family-domain-containing protein [Durotheca rogersii]
MLPPPMRAAALSPARWQCLVAPAPSQLLLLLVSSAPASVVRIRAGATTSPSPSPARSFTTTAPLARQKPSYLTVPADQVPDYPYGRSTTYKVGNTGLFGGSKVQFGNIVAEAHGNHSRRRWHPNRHTKRLWSRALGAFVRTRLTARVLATVDRLGGIDEYLLGPKARRVRDLGPAGWALRWKVMQSPAVRARFARERAALGLPPRDGDAEWLDNPPADAPADASADALGDQVDAMLRRGDEFVIGDLQDGEDVVVAAAPPAAPPAAEEPDVFAGIFEEAEAAETVVEASKASEAASDGAKEPIAEGKEPAAKKDDAPPKP